MSTKCEADHEIKWESGHIRSLGPCDGVAVWMYDSPGVEGDPILTPEHKPVCDAFRSQVGRNIIADPGPVVPYEFTPLAEVSGNTDPEKGE